MASTTRKFILTLGIPRSGSTWIFNAAAAIMDIHEPKYSAFYADTLNDFPVGAFDSLSPILIKSHGLGSLPGELIRRSKLVISMRDPRDAVAAAMQMFHFSFDEALRRVTTSIASISPLIECDQAMLLQYENNFFLDPETVSRIATFIGYPVEVDCAGSISRGLSATRVEQTIKDLQSRGAIGPDQEAEDFDPVSHWHPGHIRDGLIGKYASVLSRRQAAQVVDRNIEFARKYYLAALSPPLPVTITLTFGVDEDGNSYCGHGFSSPEKGGIWSCDEEATLILPLATPLRQRMAFTLLFSPASAAFPGTTTAFAIEVNGVFCTRKSYSDPVGAVSVDIVMYSPALAGTTNLVIKVVFDGLVCPAELGPSIDRRRLGILLSSLALDCQ